MNRYLFYALFSALLITIVTVLAWLAISAMAVIVSLISFEWIYTVDIFWRTIYFALGFGAGSWIYTLVKKRHVYREAYADISSDD